MENKTITHYVIVFDFAADSNPTEEGCVAGIEISGVAHSIEEAKAKLAKATEDERKYAKEANWRILHDSDTCFCAYEDGNYEHEHAYFFIKEVNEPLDIQKVDEPLDAISGELLDYIAEHNDDPTDYLYAIMHEADLSDEAALDYLTEAFGYKYSEEELTAIIEDYREQNF